MAEHTTRVDWDAEDAYWKTNFRNRPYVTDQNREYDYYRPGYQYGFESANRYQGREWDDVENDLERGWDRYEHRAESTWQQMKNAIRDAWDRVTGRTPASTR
jgi:hypothetical protein